MLLHLQLMQVGGMLIYTVVGGASLANIAHGCFGDKGATGRLVRLGTGSIGWQR